MTRRSRGVAMAEFAITWPLVLLAVLGSVEVATWSAESAAARSAALAGARAGSRAGATAASAQSVALAALGPALVGATARGWCPGDQGSAPQVWVCAQDKGAGMEITIGGAAPALVPLIPGARGLPLHADVQLPKEVFS